MTERGKTTIEGIAAAAVAVGDEWLTLYDRDGTESRWRHADLAKAERAGLSLTCHNLDAAFADWNANHAARAETVSRAVAELQRDGYIRDEVYDALNVAMGAEIDAYRALAAAIGATLPHESHIAALATHKAIHGTINERQLPYDKRHEPAADRMPPERVAYWQERSARDDQEAHDTIAAGIAAGLVEAPEGWTA